MGDHALMKPAGERSMYRILKPVDSRTRKMAFLKGDVKNLQISI